MKAFNALLPRLSIFLNQQDFHIIHIRFVLICVSAAVLSACASNFPDKEFYQSETAVKHTPYTLGPGDRIRVTVYEHEDLSGNYSVDDTGRISLPLIRGVNAKGFTLPELEQKLSSEFKKNYIVNPNVSIEVIERRSFCILGEVRNPGCFRHIHGLTSAQAVARAGGYTYRAYKEKFAIIREDGRKVVGFDSTPIFGGDTIQIYERYF
jgi:polysaccharide export outer membrane protein